MILVGLLLDRLEDVQRASERAVVERDVASLRAGLQLVVASRIANGDEAQLRGWAGRNPAELAAGETSGAAGSAGAGTFALTRPWRWDAKAGTLSYAYRDGECLQLHLSREEAGLASGWSLGAGLVLVHEEKCG